MLEEIRTHGLASEALAGLREAWSARTKDLARSRYEHYGDLLYAYLLEILVPHKEQTFLALRARIQTATTPKDIEVPLWSYTACYSKTQAESVHCETCIGTRVFGIPALPPVPVYKVFQCTDVLHRLASAYGADFYVYERRAETLCENDQMVQSRRELVLTYYPHGLSETLSVRIRDAYARQIGRTPYTPSWAEALSVTSPTETPPQSPPTSPPRHRRKLSREDV